MGRIDRASERKSAIDAETTLFLDDFQGQLDFHLFFPCLCICMGGEDSLVY